MFQCILQKLFKKSRYPSQCEQTLVSMSLVECMENGLGAQQISATLVRSCSCAKWPRPSLCPPTHIDLPHPIPPGSGPSAIKSV